MTQSAAVPPTATPPMKRYSNRWEMPRTDELTETLSLHQRG